MARLRKFVAYRRIERPYTRFSRYREKSYVRSRPPCRVVRFNLGDPKRTYQCTLHLVSKVDLQVRDNAIESARKSMIHLLEKNLGKTGYEMQIRMYPHHVLRENPLASGAGADRMSTGMAHSFGKPIGRAARIKKGQAIITVKFDKAQMDLAKQSLKRASYKLPCKTAIVLG